MSLSPDLLPIPWLVAGFLGYGTLVAWALSGIDRWQLRRQTFRQHLLFASSVAVMVLWLVRADGGPGLGVHVLGMTGLTLLVGWRQAMVGSLFPVVAVALAGAEPWQTVGITGIVLAALPIGVTQFVWRASEQLLPRRVITYLLVCALCGSLLAGAVTRLVVLAMLLAVGAYASASIVGDYLKLVMLILVPEGIINVAAVSALALWRPQWLSTLRQQRYLSR